MTAKELIARLWGPGINSQSRAGHLVELTAGTDAATFWEVFQMCWSTCDDTWRWQRDLLTLLRRHQPFEAHATEDHRAFLQSLPDPVRLYRGATRLRTRGMSWSTDRAVAEAFARGHRGITLTDAVTVEANVPLSSILAVDLSREEAEVLVDPRRLPKRIERAAEN